VRVLFVVHGAPPESMGGTELYVAQLARAFRELGDDVLVFAREAKVGRVEFSLRQEVRDGVPHAFVNNTYRTLSSFAATYRQPEVRARFAEVLDGYQPEVVHIHHLTHLSTDLLLELEERRLPTFVTLHDYWLWCQRGQLLDWKLQRCEGPSTPKCARCLGPAAGSGAPAHRVAQMLRRVQTGLPRSIAVSMRAVMARWGAELASPGRAERAVEERATHVRHALRGVTRFLAPSETIRRKWMAQGMEGERIVHHPLGIDARPFAQIKRTQSSRLRMGFVGTLMVSKAPHVLLQAFQALPANSAEVTLFGAYSAYHGDDSYLSVLEPLLKLPGVKHEGPRSNEEVIHALGSLDLLVVPSIWEENSPVVVREAFLAGIPVVASALGGLTELVTHEQNGLLFTPGDDRELSRLLLRFVQEPGLIDRLRRGIPWVLRIEEDAQRTRRLFEAHRSVPTPGRSRMHVAAVVLNHQTPGLTLHCVRALERGSRRPDSMVVVDNGSHDGSVPFIQAACPSATLVALPSNTGFAAGCNVGIRKAMELGADLVLLANSDVELLPNALQKLEEALHASPTAGMAGPLVIQGSVSGRVESGGMTFDTFSGRMRLLRHGARAEQEAPGTVAVQALSGCAILIRRAVLEQVGLLAEEYFFGFEDLDFCLRASRSGFCALSVRSARAVHLGSATLGKSSPRRAYFATRNHLLLATRHDSSRPPLARAARTLAIAGYNVAAVIRGGEIPLRRGLSAVGQGIRDHLRGEYGPGIR
jgi:GT2 family glycosyltransferase/glycosyltransferase involved in cell wall biosynthesis